MIRIAMLMSLAVLMVGCASSADRPPAKDVQIVCAPNASPMETLAAREIRRYVYLRTGQLLPITATAPDGDQIVVARKDRALASRLPIRQLAAALKPQQYLLKTVDAASAGASTAVNRAVYVVGGDDAGTLYAAYRLAERFGVAFDLDGDVIPDQQVALELPMLDETGKPLFELRGIQPFHDFPEGPDWWDTNHYKAVLSQLPKLRMNFFALHTYPEGGVGPEPTVWIGLPQDVGPDGAPAFSYSSSWQNTLRGNWGYQAKKTSEWSYGSSQLFEQDASGSDVMLGYCARPTTPQGYKEVFDRAGRQLKDSFEHARGLAIKTCVGTETPLIVPNLVQERMKEKGASGVQSLYEGIFQRIARTYPIDYYWFWTPEDWTWGNVSDAKVKQTIDDLQAAIAAARKVNPPFALATCGWVLGPQQDRAMFDKVLPKDMAVSCINRQVGKDLVEPGFANVQGRGKWAIPWLEDDPNLLMPQLWVGRMRKDAADSLNYGCTGLVGIHWRTKITSPNAVALAKAAWDQSPWSKPTTAPAQPQMKEGAVAGQMAAFPNNPIADTDDQPVYQTVRYNVDAYHFAVPDGKYAVTLKFCEPHYPEAGKRVFGVKLQGKHVIDQLDIFAKVGKNKALDYVYKEVEAKGGWLKIEFTRNVEFPSIAGIVIEGNGVTRKVNCGGAAYKDYAADWPAGPAGPAADRYLPSGDFYREWATARFGPEAAEDIAKVFEKVDGQLPQTSTWTDGPGGLAPNGQPWAEAARQYAFVDELAGLRGRVRGAANLERFDYWLNNFRYMRATERVKCLWAQFNEVMKQVAAEKDTAEKVQLAEGKALPIRKELVGAVAEAYGYLLRTVYSPGELGTVANWEQHVFPAVLTNPGRELYKVLNSYLGPAAEPSPGYTGQMRLIVPTVRTSMKVGEKLEMKVLVLSQHPVLDVALYWRRMGRGGFSRVAASPVARGVYAVTVPAQDASVDAIEYYIEARSEQAEQAVFPVTGQRMCQTVVVAP